jgi:uncharacterized protein (DUF58 family)
MEAPARRSPAFRRFLLGARRLYPLTLAGTLAAAAAFFLLGRGLAQANPYAVFLALLAAVVLTLLVVAGRLLAAACARRQFQWDCSATLIARRPGTEQAIQAPEARLPPFFRVQFRFSGQLAAGNGAWVRLARSLSFALPGTHPLPLYLPLCGELTARGHFLVRDVFGLTRARFGEELQRFLTVLPAWIAPGPPRLVEPAGGFEDKSLRKASEEEKYFMREYQPGDRFRDINWKVSSRLQELITRISPVTQEKTRLLAVDFRHYRPAGPESLESVLHLDYLKSWLLAFLRGLKAANERLQFRVRTAAGSRLLATAEDIEAFAEELSGLAYQSDPGPGTEEAGELFVFSTPFDKGLPLYLAARPLARAQVFRTVRARAPARTATGGWGAAPAAGVAGRGAGREPAIAAREPAVAAPIGGDGRQRGPGNGPVERVLFLPEPSEVFLPGPWALRRGRLPAAPPLPAAAVEETALAVRLFP